MLRARARRDSVRTSEVTRAPGAAESARDAVPGGHQPRFGIGLFTEASIIRFSTARSTSESRLM